MIGVERKEKRIMKILLIEDDIEISEMLCSYLIAENFEVVCATDGQKACEAFDIGSYSIVLLDLMIPKITGMNVMKYKQYNTNQSDLTAEPAEYDEKGLYICPASHKCTLNGVVLPLTPFEFNILWYLCKNHGRVVSAEELFETVWGERFFESNNNTVMAHIARIREKMSEPARKPKYIKTVWGVGYTIE